MFIAELTNYLQISPCRQFHFYVHVTMHRWHSEGKEPNTSNKVCSFIASTCFGHQYAHHQEYN
jgi:hypothetical protein